MKINFKNALKFTPALVIVLPLIGYAFMDSNSGSYFANVASAGYGSDKVDVCIPIHNRAAQFVKVTVPQTAANALIARRGAVYANNGQCPGTTIGRGHGDNEDKNDDKSKKNGRDNENNDDHGNQNEQ